MLIVLRDDFITTSLAKSAGCKSLRAGMAYGSGGYRHSCGKQTSSVQPAIEMDPDGRTLGTNRRGSGGWSPGYAVNA